MEEDYSLYLQLHKLSAITTEEASLDHMLTTLWNTRRTGLRSPEKSHIQSLLKLSSLPELDPVLACIRSLIRKSVHENYSGDDFLKLFPPDLSFDLQSILILLLQKYQNQWKDELSKEQHQLPRISFSYQLKASMPPSYASLPSSEISMPFWPGRDDLNGRFNRNDLGISTPITADTRTSNVPPFSVQHDASPPDNLGNLPCLKSMTWTMENHNSAPENKIAVISLKLQDLTKSPPGEMEVKFQLNKETLEAMLRSLNYINDQLSSTVQSSTSGPVQKKQKQ